MAAGWTAPGSGRYTPMGICDIPMEVSTLGSGRDVSVRVFKGAAAMTMVPVPNAEAHPEYCPNLEDTTGGFGLLICKARALRG